MGDGGTVRGIDENNTVTDKNGLFGIHMPGYYNAVNKGVATVMVSYSALNGLRMHANKELVTGFLKNKLKFRVRHDSSSCGCTWLFFWVLKSSSLFFLLQGFVISDWQGIDRITNPPHLNYSSSLYAGISAGIDMVGSRK